jgi:hypothetical protein
MPPQGLIGGLYKPGICINWPVKRRVFRVYRPYFYTTYRDSYSQKLRLEQHLPL